MIIRLSKEAQELLDKNEKIICIYKITDLTNGKIYIGQSINFKKRISNYKRTAFKPNITRFIDQAIVVHGCENFLIEDIEIVNDINELNRKEHGWIIKLDASNPEIGYNANLGSTHDYSQLANLRKSLSHKGLKEKFETKRKKSNTIIAIGNGKVIIADSGKLFGDFVGKGKDYIKNCLREPSTINGYNLYYADPIKLITMRHKMLNKKTIRNPLYMKYLDLLELCEFESVETIYSSLRSIVGKVYLLNYENRKEPTNEHPEGELFLVEVKPTETGTDQFAG